MIVHRPPDLTTHERDVLALLLMKRTGTSESETFTQLRAATIMYPESTWLRDLARPWFQYQIDLKRAEVAADNAPAPEGWKPRCLCGHFATDHRVPDYCLECACTRYEPRDDT